MDRRRFLLGTGLAMAAGAVAACADEAADGESDGSRTDGRASEADLDFLVFAAGLEALAVETYRSSLDSAAGGKLGEVPAVGAEFLQVAHDQHGQYLDTINGVLETNGREAVTDPSSAARKSVVEPGLGAATGFLSIARVVRNLETALAATYLKAAQSQLQERDLIRTAGGIQATGQKRVAILSFIIGEFPFPDPFHKTDAAVTA